MGVNIREARMEDAAALQKFVAELLHESLDVVFKRSEVPDVQNRSQFIARMQAEPNSCLFLAFDGDELVGILDLHGSQHIQTQHCAGFGMSVARRFRNLGVGRALLASMLEFAKRNETLRRVELEVFENNAPAIQLYQSMNFRLEGRKRGSVWVSGEYIDVLCMALSLQEE